MKRLSWRLGLAAACAVLTLVGRATPVWAAEEEQKAPGDRLDRLERQVNQMAQRQELLMQRLRENMEQRGQMGAPGDENFRPPMDGFRHRWAGSMPPGMGAGGPGAMRGPDGVRPHLAKLCKDISGLLGLAVLVCLACNILLAIWIARDIRKRGEGSGIFIALAILAGFPTAIVYTLSRIAERKP